MNNKKGKEKGLLDIWWTISYNSIFNRFRLEVWEGIGYRMQASGLTSLEKQNRMISGNKGT